MFREAYGVVVAVDEAAIRRCTRKLISGQTCSKKTRNAVQTEGLCGWVLLITHLPNFSRFTQFFAILLRNNTEARIVKFVRNIPAFIYEVDEWEIKKLHCQHELH